MKIVYATISVHPTYHQISKHLIDTFLKHTKDSTLLVMTDDASFYNQYGQHTNIIPIQHEGMVTGVPSVNLNIKYKLLQIAHKYDPTHIVLFDCDSYFAKDMNNEWFGNLPIGVNVVIGDQQPTFKIQNPTIKRKIVAFEPNENKIWKLFREGSFVVVPGNNFVPFTNEWERLYRKVLDENLTFTSEVFEINLACERSGFPLNNLGIHPIRDILWMQERNGAVAPSLR